tara:strand:+ start:396 stop:503 length:108 start_codon:yes stop_codon:yes gene_type:complete
MYKLMVLSILFIGWFILSVVIINKGDRKSLWKKGF